MPAKPTPRHLRIAGLPGILADIARVCGDDVAVRFAAAFGDTDLHIPRLNRLRQDHPLIRAVGRRAARVIAERFGGREYSVPTGRWSITHHTCRLARLAGWSARSIGRSLGLAASTVERLTADIEPETPVPQPITVRCPSCGRPHRLAPPPIPDGTSSEAEDDSDAAIEALPPLMRLGVRQGVFTLEEIKAFERSLAVEG